MRINRGKALGALTEFVQVGNGVIVGIPGTGKTFLLAQLVTRLIENEVPACLIKLEALSDGDESEITALLGMNGNNWLEQLAGIPVPPESKGVLVFDGFDSVRDEVLKKRILLQIANAKAKLPGWSIIASVRTYDALKSPRLIELFPAQFNTDGINCRRHPIPVLTDEEVAETLALNDSLNRLYAIANVPLKQLFRIPFFLSLMDLILAKAPGETERLSTVKSEIDLLDLYWSKVVYRIEPALITETFLQGLTEQMVNTRQLSVDLLTYLSGVGSAQALVADKLLSENVLSQQGIQFRKIGFAHNILFDYAVSRYLIKGSSAEINAFIQADLSRVLFLRPSFIYFFTRLWYHHRELFWGIYHEFSAFSDNTIRLFNKLIISAVFVMEFDEAEDFPKAANSTARIAQITDIIQALLYLDGKADKLQHARLLERISCELQPAFTGLYAMLLRKFIDTVELKTETDIFDLCGMAARNLYEFSMANAANWEPLITYQAIPMVASTYASDITKSRKIIDQVLSVMETPGFSIAKISAVLINLKHIYLVDPELTEEIYYKVFQQDEQTDERANVQASLMFTFSMSRRDDFHLCRHRLKEFFPTYLKAFPEKAIRLALNLVLASVRKINKYGINPPGFTFPLKFEINGIPTGYEIDTSDLWSEYSKPEELELLEAVFTYFDELVLVGNGSVVVEQYIPQVILHATTGVIWKRLLMWAVNNAGLIHPQIFEVLLQPAILYWSATFQEAGAMLEAAVPFFNDEQVKNIEEAIHSLKQYLPQESANDYGDRRIFQLLSRIPLGRHQLNASREMFADREPVEIEPDVEFSSYSGEYTERMAMADSGIDVEEPVNNEFITVKEELEAFCREQANSYPIPVQYKPYLQKAIDQFVRLKSTPHLDQKIAESLLRQIASTCVIILRADYGASRHQEKRDTDYIVIQEILLECVAMHLASDTFAEQNYSAGSVYTTTPKSEAAGGLVFLWRLTGDNELLSTIELISKDKNPIARVRLLDTIQFFRPEQNELFWSITLERLRNEIDNYIKSLLIERIDKKNIFEKEQDLLLQALSIVQPQVIHLDGRNLFLQQFLFVCSAFYRFSGNKIAKQLLEETIYGQLNLASAFVFEVFKIIEPANHFRDYQSEDDIALSKRLLDFLGQLADNCGEIISSCNPNNEPSEEIQNAVSVLNGIVKRIYYSLQVNEAVFNRPSSKISIISQEDKSDFYTFIKPLLLKIFTIGDRIGHMEPVTARFLIEILGSIVDLDPSFSLYTIKRINQLVSGSMYTYDQGSVSETIKFVEHLLADHRELLLDLNAFSAVVDLLNIYAMAGWAEALELLRRLDEVFR